MTYEVEPGPGLRKPYTVGLAYTYSILDLMGEQNCPSQVEVFSPDVEVAILEARMVVPHAYGITRVVES